MRCCCINFIDGLVLFLQLPYPRKTTSHIIAKQMKLAQAIQLYMLYILPYLASKASKCSSLVLNRGVRDSLMPPVVETPSSLPAKRKREGAITSLNRLMIKEPVDRWQKGET